MCRRTHQWTPMTRKLLMRRERLLAITRIISGDFHSRLKSFVVHGESKVARVENVSRFVDFNF